jgi:hypothetical protein
MRWVKIMGLLASGAVIGGLLIGYVMFEYMTRFGIAWNQWASSQYDERKATDALSTVATLTKIRAGNMEGARSTLEWRLTGDIAELAAMKKTGHDPGGYTTKALAAIGEYKQANPWSSGNPELDKLTAEALSGAASAQRQTH